MGSYNYRDILEYIEYHYTRNHFMNLTSSSDTKIQSSSLMICATNYVKLGSGICFHGLHYDPPPFVGAMFSQSTRLTAKQCFLIRLGGQKFLLDFSDFFLASTVCTIHFRRQLPLPWLLCTKLLWNIYQKFFKYNIQKKPSFSSSPHTKMKLTGTGTRIKKPNA